MKNLVKKIALPGAILAFAMAFFGGAAYAGSEWHTTEGAQHLNAISDNISKLEGRIHSLMKQKSLYEKNIKDSTTTINQLTADKEKLSNDLKSLESQSASESAENQSKIAELERQIEKSDESIKKLLADITGKGKWVEEHQAELKSLRGQVTKLQNSLDEKDEKVNQLTAAIKHAEIVRKASDDAVDHTAAAEPAE